MNNLNNITQDWTHADQFLNDKIDKNTNSIKHDFDIVEKNVEVLNGVAEGQFVTDSTAMSVKVVPENAVKGIVSMIGGKTVKQDDVLLNAPVKKVVLTGANLWDEQYKTGYYASDTGVYKSATGQLCSNDRIEVKPNTSYYMVNGREGLTYVWYTESDTFISSSRDSSKAVVSPSNAKYLRFNLGSIYGAVYNHDISIVEGESGTYTPYVDKTTLLLDKIVDKLPDYGASVNDNLYNYVDFEEMVYHHKVGSALVSDLTGTWGYSQSNNYFYTKAPSDARKVATGYDIANLLCDKYTTIDNAGYNHGTNKSVSLDNSGNIGFVDSGYTSVDTFKIANANTEFLYELAQEELIPLTDLLLPFKVEAGGTITFENEHNLDVPNTVIYEKEMK